MSARCNKCGQAEPHLGDSWCLGCAACEALVGELKCSWGNQGTRALATDILSTAVRQVRALRRLGIAGAGRIRASSPTGADPRASERPRSPTRREVPPAAAPPAEEPPRPRSEAKAPAAEVKTEAADREPSQDFSEYEYTDEEDEPEEKEPEASGLRAVPKAPPPPKPERSEIPRRRSVAPGPDSPTARSSHRRPHSEHRDGRGEREDRRRSRDRSRSRRRRSNREPGKRRRRRRPGHRGGSKHQKVWKAAQDPYRRFHSRQPDTFWDRPPPAF